MTTPDKPIAAEFIERQLLAAATGGTAYRFYRVTEYEDGSVRHRVSTRADWEVAELARLADVRAADYPRAEMDDDYLHLEAAFLAALDLAESLKCQLEDAASGTVVLTPGLMETLAGGHRLAEGDMGLVREACRMALRPGG